MFLLLTQEHPQPGETGYDTAYPLHTSLLASAVHQAAKKVAEMEAAAQAAADEDGTVYRPIVNQFVVLDLSTNPVSEVPGSCCCWSGVLPAPEEAVAS